MSYVLFRKSFAHENAPNITHLTKPDGSATLCGRRGWETNEGPFRPNDGVDCLGVDCLRCAAALKNLEKEKP